MTSEDLLHRYWADYPRRVGFVGLRGPVLAVCLPGETREALVSLAINICAETLRRGGRCEVSRGKPPYGGWVAFMSNSTLFTAADADLPRVDARLDEVVAAAILGRPLKARILAACRKPVIEGVWLAGAGRPPAALEGVTTHRASPASS